MNPIIVNNTVYTIIKLLGHGKGGYSYLAATNGGYFVLKQIHHEPCDYYQFGDKLQSELRDYQTLSKIDIDIPLLIDVDVKGEIIIKEYINGPTVAELVEAQTLGDFYIKKILEIQDKCRSNGINIDYYPTNFVVRDDKLYYIDYECNVYDSKWDFDNWGRQFWITKR